MKRIKLLVAAAAMLTATSVASAAENLWFTLENVNAGVTATSSGPGQVLVIDRAANPGPNLVLRIGINITSSTDLFAGWQVNLANIGPAVWGNCSVPAGIAANYNQNQGDLVGAGGEAGRGALQANGAEGLLYVCDLTVSGDATAGQASVSGSFGSGGIYESDGTWWFGSAAGGPSNYGAEDPTYTGGGDSHSPGWGPPLMPVISIVPEPATLGLLGIGVVALIRRRK